MYDVVPSTFVLMFLGGAAEDSVRNNKIETAERGKHAFCCFRCCPIGVS
jgi:hypothetical protein